jgi:flagellar hook-associated protein 1
MSVFGGIGIGGRALSAYQAAMDIIGHNVANADTEGYSRQRATLAATAPDKMAYGDVGTGVEVIDVRRIRDAYLDLQNYTELGTLGQWEMKDKELEKLELYFPEPSDTSLNNLLSDFWQAWSDVADSPDDQTSRENLVQQSLLLTDSINNTRAKMGQCQENIDGLIQSKVDEVNSISSQVAVLNGQIQSSEVGGNPANDLRDKRDLLVSQLASIINFNLNEQDNGTYAISVSGKQLVWNTDAAEMTAVPDSSNGNLVELQWAGTGETITPTSGELAGLFSVRDTSIPEYIEKLDTLVGNLIEEVNTLHSQGWGLSGQTGMTSENALSAADTLEDLPFGADVVDGTVYINPVDSSGAAVTPVAVAITHTMTMAQLAAAINAAAGTYVTAAVDSDGYLTIARNSTYTFAFTDSSAAPTHALTALGINTFFSGSTSATVSVKQSIQDDSDTIAAASSFSPGDNSNARAIADLMDTSIDGLSTTFSEYYQSRIIGTLGIEIEQASQIMDNETLIVDQLKDNIQSVSGVSLDEEMSTMIQYQHAYEAAAKYMTMASDMLDALMNII